MDRPVAAGTYWSALRKQRGSALSRVTGKKLAAAECGLVHLWLGIFNGNTNTGFGRAWDSLPCAVAALLPIIGEGHSAGGSSLSSH